MTYQELVKKVQTALVKADASGITEHIAVQVNVTGDAAGAFYIEVKDGVLYVEPYDYYDRDCLLTGDSKEILAIAQGKSNLKEAIMEAHVFCEGNYDKISLISEIIPKKVRKPRATKTETAKETKKTVEKTAEKSTAKKTTRKTKPVKTADIPETPEIPEIQEILETQETQETLVEKEPEPTPAKTKKSTSTRKPKAEKIAETPEVQEIQEVVENATETINFLDSLIGNVAQELEQKAVALGLGELKAEEVKPEEIKIEEPKAEEPEAKIIDAPENAPEAPAVEVKESVTKTATKTVTKNSNRSATSSKTKTSADSSKQKNMRKSGSKSSSKSKKTKKK